MRNFLKGQKTIIGMIHVEPLPGTPRGNSGMAEIIAKAKAEAQLYKEAGMDMLAIENMHDVPFHRAVGPEIVAAMADPNPILRQRATNEWAELLERNRRTTAPETLTNSSSR